LAKKKKRGRDFTQIRNLQVHQIKSGPEKKGGRKVMSREKERESKQQLVVGKLYLLYMKRKEKREENCLPLVFAFASLIGVLGRGGRQSDGKNEEAAEVFLPSYLQRRAAPTSQSITQEEKKTETFGGKGKSSCTGVRRSFLTTEKRRKTTSYERTSIFFQEVKA